MGITAKHIENAFKECEATFNFCWEVLADIKLNRIQFKDFTGRLLLFQEKLASCLFALQLLRDKITAQQRQLIDRKQTYQYKWFSAKMKVTRQYIEGIDKANNIGKSIGDAFAYMFYQEEPEFWEEHLNHPPITNFNALTGGKGEINFVQQFRHIEGCLTIYHGITHSLRIGDFSFFDLRTMRITKIAELKTTPGNDDELKLNLTILERVSVSVETYKANLQEKPHASNKFEARLVRQIEKMAKVLASSKKGGSDVQLTLSFHYDQVSAAYSKMKRNTVVPLQVSPGLIYSLVKYRPASLFHKLFLRKAAAITRQIHERGTDFVLSILKERSLNNSVVIGKILYDKNYCHYMLPGTVPLYWSMSDLSLLHDLYFADGEIVSLFNPAFLIEQVEHQAFQFTSRYKHVDSKTVAPEKMIANFDTFIPYITEFLYAEDFVLHIIAEGERAAGEHPEMKQLIRHRQRI